MNLCLENKLYAKMENCIAFITGDSPGNDLHFDFGHVRDLATESKVQSDTLNVYV